jgi:hypothetical protein
MKQESKRLQIEKASIADDEQLSRTIKVLQSGHLGDMMYCLSATKRASIVNKAKIQFMVGFKESNGVMGHPSGKYCMNTESYQYIKPLLEYQDYIESVNIYDLSNVKYNFDQFRRWNSNLAAGDLRKHHHYIYPELHTDLTEVCITAPPPVPDFKNHILINLSSRYRNNQINYSFLKDYDCLFFGLDSEYNNFVNKYQFEPYRVNLKNALQTAQLLASVKLFIGNQSSTFAIAEQMKIPRLLEVYYHCPNVIPMGINGYDYYNQSALEYFVKQKI